MQSTQSCRFSSARRQHDPWQFGLILLGIGKVFADDSQDQPNAALDAELAEKMLQMGVDRIQRDSKAGGDFSFVFVIENQPHNLEFTLREGQTVRDSRPLFLSQKRVQTGALQDSERHGDHFSSVQGSPKLRTESVGYPLINHAAGQFASTLPDFCKFWSYVATDRGLAFRQIENRKPFLCKAKLYEPLIARGRIAVHPNGSAPVSLIYYSAPNEPSMAEENGAAKLKIGTGRAK